MLYGFNFNGTPIPPTIERRFAKRLAVRGGKLKAVSSDEGCNYVLAGVADTTQDRDHAISQAANGVRKIVVRRRLISETSKVGTGKIYYGIYTGYDR